jgi:hypothetical protein
MNCWTATTTVPASRWKTKSLDSRICTLKAVFDWFQWLHLTDANPFEGIEPPWWTVTR